MAYRRGDQSCTHARRAADEDTGGVSTRQVRTFSERACGCGTAASTATLPRPDPPRGQISQTAAGARAACRVPLPPQRHGNGRPESHSQVTADGSTAPRARSTSHPGTATTTRARTKRTQQPRSPVGVGGWRKGRVGPGGRWLVSRARRLFSPLRPYLR